MIGLILRSSIPIVILLIVDDEAPLLFSAADDLRDTGFDLLEAINADAATALLLRS